MGIRASHKTLRMRYHMVVSAQDLFVFIRRSTANYRRPMPRLYCSSLVRRGMEAYASNWLGQGPMRLLISSRTHDRVRVQMPGTNIYWLQVHDGGISRATFRRSFLYKLALRLLSHSSNHLYFDLNLRVQKVYTLNSSWRNH